MSISNTLVRKYEDQIKCLKLNKGSPGMLGVITPEQMVSTVDNPLASRQKSQAKRLSLTLSSECATVLEYLAETQDISQNEVIRRSLGTEAYLQREISAGSRILIQDSQGNLREIVFR